MGAYLSEPVTEKVSHDETYDHVAWGVSGMQGWRMSMEDAHCCHADIDEKKNSLFGVFDGHGGKEVAEYCAQNFQNFLLDCEEYREGDINGALRKAFLAIDEAITSDEVIEELKAMTGNTEDEEDDDEAALLLEEANMPIGQLLERFKGNVKEKLKENGILVEEDAESAEKGHVEEEKAEVVLNGHAESAGDEKPSKEKSRKQKNPVKRTTVDTGAGGSSGSSSSNGVDNSVPTGSSSSGGSSSHGSSGGSNSASSEESTESCSSSGGSGSATNTQEPETSSNVEEQKNDGKTIGDMQPPDDDDDDDDDEDEEAESEDDEDDEDDDEEFEDAEDVEFQQGSEEVGKDSGTTAIVALIYKNKLYVANAGDSRCVLCRNGLPIEMSVDHKPEDEPEKTRIERAGGKITGDGRINGGLNLSRAIGDHTYKQNTELSPEEQIITACPDIKEIELANDDKFMVLACDGIWNVMTNDEVIDFVNIRLKGNEEEENILSKICEELFDHCLAPNTDNDGTGCDNMTCIIVKFKNENYDSASKISGKRTNNSMEEKTSKKAKLNAMD